MAARQRDDGETGVSLFPFLSILACMIGTLTLMIMALALTGMTPTGGREEDEVARAEENARLQKALKASRSKIIERRKQVGQAKAVNQKVTLAQTRVQSLRDAEKMASASAAQVAKLKAQRAALQKTVAQKKARVATMEKDAARLSKELKALNASIATRQQVSSDATLQVLPPSGGAKLTYTPTFVEARKTGITIHTGAKPREIATGNIGKDKSFADLLKRLSGDASSQIVLLIRSDGLDARAQVLNHTRKHGVVCGQLPLLGKGKLDLSGVGK